MVGKSKRGKGTKIMTIVDGHGLPIGIRIASASPHEEHWSKKLWMRW
jgi:hypothetical protein